jgi:hypothetical protein
MKKHIYSAAIGGQSSSRFYDVPPMAAKKHHLLTRRQSHRAIQMAPLRGDGASVAFVHPAQSQLPRVCSSNTHHFHLHVVRFGANNDE